MPEFRVAFKLSRELLGGAFLLSSLSTTGCFLSHAKPAPRAFRPPPVQVQPVVTAKAVIDESGPDLELEAPENPANGAPLQMPEFPAPPKPAPPPVKAALPRTLPQPEPLAPPPNITQLLSADQRNALYRSYGESLSLLVRDLEALSKKRLSADQTSQMERIRVFKEQAEELFKHDDLVTAAQLARRAFNLAEDLVSRAR